MSVFREKSIERISSPEDLDSYLRVANPPMWFGLGAVILLLAGAIIWGIFGTLDSTVSAVTICRDGKALCYVRESDYAKVTRDDEVRLDGNTFLISSMDSEAQRAETVLNDYAMHLGEIDEGEYVHALTLEDCPAAEGSYASSVVVERIPAISFLWN